jgi:hypothetical protein
VTAETRASLESLEESALDLPVVLCWLVREEVEIPEPELKGARRRAMLTLAAGGDPHRALDLDSVAVDRLAEELDAPGRRAALAAALDALPGEGLPRVAEALTLLRQQPELAWRSLALALLADEISDD